MFDSLQDKFSAQSLNKFFQHRDVSDQNFNAFSVEEWRKSVSFFEHIELDGALITSADTSFFQEYLQRSIESKRSALYYDSDSPYPSYSFIETSEDVFSWLSNDPDNFSIFVYGEEQERLTKNLIPAYKAGKAEGARFLFEGLLCPQEKPGSVVLEIMSLYLVAPTDEQKQAVENSMGTLNEFSLIDFHNLGRKRFLEAYPESALSILYQEKVIGASWGWNEHSW